MRNLFLKIATKMNWRVLVTIIGVAACVTYMTGTSAMVGGLKSGTEALAARVEEGPYLIFRGDSLLTSSIPGSDTSDIGMNFTTCWVEEVKVLIGDSFLTQTFAVACNDPLNQVGLGLENVSESEVWIGRAVFDNAAAKNLSLPWGSIITLAYGNETKNLSRTKIWSGMFSDEWVILNTNTLENLTSSHREQSFLLVPKDKKKEVSLLKEKGYQVVPTTGTVEFFQESIAQVEQDLWSIALTSLLIIFLLVLSLLGVEVHYRKKDIDILRSLGASPGLILGIFLGQTLFISSFGAVLGVALGIITTNFVISFSSLVGYATLITPEITFQSTIMPIILAICSGLAGGVLPAYFASRRRERRAD